MSTLPIRSLTLSAVSVGFSPRCCYTSRPGRRPAWVDSGRSLIGAHGLRGSRIVNSLYSPTSLSTAMLPPCCCVTMS